MHSGTHLRFERRPSIAGLMLAAVRNSGPRRRVPHLAPDLRASWHGIHIAQCHLHAFHTACALDQRNGISPLYPMTLAYPLILRMLSDAASPIPLLHALNTCMLIQQYHPLTGEEQLDLDCAVISVRRVEKGMELDIRAQLETQGTRLWECCMTFFYRGRFEGPIVAAASDSGFRIEPSAEVHTWRMPAAGALRFGRLCGDTNPLHYGRLYAKAFGFERDFAQPLLVLGQALSRLPPLSGHAISLEARLKGPVYYERALRMSVARNGQECGFDIYCEPNTRPSICARVGMLD